MLTSNNLMARPVGGNRGAVVFTSALSFGHVLERFRHFFWFLGGFWSSHALVSQKEGGARWSIVGLVFLFQPTCYHDIFWGYNTRCVIDVCALSAQWGLAFLVQPACHHDIFWVIAPDVLLMCVFFLHNGAWYFWFNQHVIMTFF